MQGAVITAHITIGAAGDDCRLDRGETVEYLQQSACRAEKSTPEMGDQQTAQDKQDQECDRLAEPEIGGVLKCQPDGVEKFTGSDGHGPTGIIEGKEEIERKPEHDIFAVAGYPDRRFVQFDLDDGNGCQEFRHHAPWTGPAAEGPAEDQGRDADGDPTPHPEREAGALEDGTAAATDIRHGIGAPEDTRLRMADRDPEGETAERVWI